jgi:ATP-dependent Lon protease
MKKDRNNNNLVLEIIDIDKNKKKYTNKSDDESNYESDNDKDSHVDIIESDEDEVETDNEDNNSDDEDNLKNKHIQNRRETIDKFKNLANELLSKNKKNKLAKQLLKNSEGEEKKLNKLTDGNDRQNNLNEFKKLVKQKEQLDTLNYFKKNLSIEEQKNQIESIKEINNDDNEKPYLLKLLELDIPNKYKEIGLKKFNRLYSLEPEEPEYFKIINWFDTFISYVLKLKEFEIFKKYEELVLKKVNTLSSSDSDNGEYHKLKNWVDTFVNIPFNKYSNLPITINDGIENCHEFMSNCKNTLNDVVYGMNDVKIQIMQMIGQWIANPNSIGTAIAIKGPMGTGKTTLIKDGISKILNRPFNILALGGATDSSYLEGHSYTYEGSTWGKIVDILLQSKSSNPIIFFDELDKVSDTPKGEEITGILTHLTDTTQNTNFHDKYFSEIDFDLSKSLFIFSYNDESKINPILLDRMYKISVKGYDVKEKIVIAKKYLLPKIYEQINFNKEDIIIDDDMIKYIVDNYTETEDGVRNLKRCLEIIFTKLNLFRLMKPGENLFEEDLSIKIEFPLIITEKILKELIKNKKTSDEKWKLMYM